MPPLLKSLLVGGSESLEPWCSLEARASSDRGGFLEALDYAVGSTPHYSAGAMTVAMGCHSVCP
ncbi:hypothetical protein BH20ACT23_BH20ACT23_04140 [soil metagenome]